MGWKPPGPPTLPPRGSVYDPHLCRELEMEIWKQKFTTCSNRSCEECFPSGNIPAEVQVNRKGAAYGVEFTIPPDVPDHAHMKARVMLESNTIDIMWTWTDKESGSQVALRQLVPDPRKAIWR